LGELGTFARAHGKKLDLSFIVPAQCDRIVRRDGYHVQFVRIPRFRERRPYDEDVLYPATKSFANRLLGKRSLIYLKRFDVVLANSFAFGELIARARLDNIVYISHRPEFLREKSAKHFKIMVATKRRLERDARLEAKSIENSKRTITMSRACKRELVRRFNRSSIDVIYNGVDTNLFSKVRCERDGKIVFTYAGRNHPEKGVDLLLRSIRHVVDRGCRNFELRLLTDDGVFLKRSVKRMDLSRWVKLVGWKRVYELPRYYSASTFTIMPSYWESFSYTTAESLACESPTIASTAGALPEIVNDGVGLQFRVGEERELAERLEEACSYDPYRVAEMGRQGRMRVKRRFSKRTFLSNYLRYIERFANGTLS
ncbi:MAG TPA: glycosyltransferase, partial [Hadesarchaea archaeon]|nr:glycosyltransferase [Hadesarchaea archaeon]